jgi:competence protein ComGF
MDKIDNKKISNKLLVIFIKKNMSKKAKKEKIDKKMLVAVINFLASSGFFGIMYKIEKYGREEKM